MLRVRREKSERTRGKLVGKRHTINLSSYKQVESLKFKGECLPPTASVVEYFGFEVFDS